MLSRDKKESGILLHISSLPSEYGIGTFGREAYDFVDFLKKSNQKYWQILPLVPMGEGNSPYKSASAFAGEILFINLEILVEQGLLMPEEISPPDFPENVDYYKLRKYKIPLLKLAASRYDVFNKDYKIFTEQKSEWLDDYALFMAIKDKTGNLEFSDFDDEYKYRNPMVLSNFTAENRELINFYKITQYLFFSQYFGLKAYAQKNGIKIIGDIPIYVSLDSADVWKNPKVFRLGNDMTPVLVAGVPPDVFSEEGQLWGNPIYDWNYLKKTDYLWWRQRLQHCAKLYDVIRIDHFRAFASYYTITYGSETARNGTWESGVGIGFFNRIAEYLGKLNIIAEDLGGNTPDVQQLVTTSGFPNMKVLQFAFNSDYDNDFLPKNYNKNCICYTGTHDNDTTVGWYNSASLAEKSMFDQLVPNIGTDSTAFKLISYGMKSKAKIVIVPMQDYLSLDTTARMNIPGTKKGNWEWRMPDEYYNIKTIETIISLSKGRNA